MPIYMGIFDKPNVLSPKFKGEVTAKGYEGWIELDSAQLGSSRAAVSATGTGSNREASAPTVHEVVVTKSADRASTALFQASFDGKGKLTILAFVGGDGNAYLTIILQDMMISSYSVSGDKKPMEIMSLNFTKITYATSPKSPNITTGALEGWKSYDVATP